MKKLLSTMLPVLFAVLAQAQVDTLLNENFNGGTTNMISNCLPAGGGGGWTIDNTLWSTPPNSLNGSYVTNDSCFLVSPLMDFTAYQFVFLDFNHIAKISFFDRGGIDISTDGGTTWAPFTNFNVNYIGNSSWPSNNNFTAASYPLVWQPGNDQAAPNNSWWKHERFELVAFHGMANIKIRFVVRDLDGNGMNGAHGWNLDDIRITAANCELVPPVINLHPTFTSQCTTIPTDNFGCKALSSEYQFSVGIEDPQSGVAFADLFYQINSTGWQSIGGLLNCSDSDWVAILNPTLTVGDTVYWYVTATDASTCANVATSPTVYFVICVPPCAPVCDNFDGSSSIVWTPTTNGASNWQLGFPGFGLTNSPHSAPNAWDIDLNSGYTNNAICDLTSNTICFDTVFNATVSFWINYATDPGGDGMQLQWKSSTHPTWTTLGAAGDPVNWYNSTLFSGGDAWSGTSNGWTPVSHKINLPGIGGDPAVQFRFHFTSDGFNTVDGFSIDDFCITVPPPNDIGVSAIISPPGFASENDTVPICVQVSNYGAASQSNFTVTATWNGNTYTTVYSGSLVGGDSVQVCFPGDSVIINSGTNPELCAYTSLPDTVPVNDTSCVISIGIPTIPIPYCDDFENGNIGWTTDIQGAAGSDWEFGTPAWGATSGAHSPVNAWDINLNAAYNNGAISYLISPFFDFLGQDSIRLSFWENWNTETNWDGTRLDYDAGAGWTKLGTVGSPYGTNWYTNVINSSNDDAWAGNSGGWVNCKYKLVGEPALNTGGSARFRFAFTSDASVTVDGVSIDDFCLKAPCFFDVGITTIVQPTINAPVGGTLPVSVTLINDGTTTLTSFPITYLIDTIGSTPVTFNWTGNLGADDTLTVNLPPFTVPTGAYTICIYTQLPQDCDFNNDTMCISLVGIPTLNVTYCDDFENGNVGWSTVINPTFDPNTIWEFGTPAFGATTGAHSGVNAWDVNLASGYGNNANTYLYTPFFDFSTVSGAVLSFWQNFNTDNGADGVTMEYSADNGVTWNILGTSLPNPDAINWYNTASLNFTNIPAWSGNSGGWEKSTYFLCHTPDLNNTVDKVQFRWLFSSNFFVTNTSDGYSIDDFCIVQPSGDDIGISAIVSPTGSVPAGAPLSISVNLHNYGTTTVTNATIVCTVDTQQLAPFSLSVNLGPCDELQNLALPGTFNAPSGPYTLCCYTDWTSDVNHNNDTTCVDLIGIPTYTLDFTHWFTDNFDSTNLGWSGEIDPNGDPGTNWEWGIPGQITPSVPSTAHSAPKVWDVNLNAQYTDNAKCYLYTPYFDMTNAVDGILRFWSNYNSENGWDGVHVEYTFDNGTSWNTLGLQGGVPPNPLGTINWYNSILNSCNCSGWSNPQPPTDTWSLMEYPIGTVPGMNNSTSVRFRFVFTSDVTIHYDGHALDDFEIEIPVPLDISPSHLSLDTLIHPNNLLFTGQNVFLSTWIKNRGTASLTQATATLYEGGFTNVVQTLIKTFSPNPLLKKDSAWIEFTTPWVATPGVHDFCVVTSQPNGTQDLNTSNDTTCFSIVVFDSVAAYPYCNDFENAPQWVALETDNYAWQNSWQLGTPSQTFLSSAHSPTKAWTINLTQNYRDGDQSSLFSPVFMVSSNKCYKLSFFHQFKCERFEDGGAVEYSLDHGATWKNIDFAGTPNATPFNYTYVSALNFNAPPLVKGWTGTSNGWLYGEKVLRPNVNGSMIIRWKFAADFDSTQEGWTVDDVCLTDIGFCSPIGIEELGSHGFELAQNHPNPFGASTTFDFTLPQDGFTKLYISDIMGQIVAVPVQDKLQAGVYSLNFDAQNLAPGIYYYTLDYNDQSITKKMVITR